MRQVALAAFALALAVQPALAAVPLFPGGKSRDCPRLEALLAKLEARPAPSPALLRRLERLRRRVADRCVALNEIQVLGSHNSFHVQPQEPLFSLLVAFTPEFRGVEYTHAPLLEQFDAQGIRQIELDVFADPFGGLYARRGGLIAIGQDPETHIPALEEPGLKVLHIQDVDFETRCLTFVECLRAIKAWSDDHPGHLPLAVLVEAKDDPIPDPLNFGFAVPVPFGPAEVDAIDVEIRSVFPERQLLTPDDVRRGRPSLEEAVLALGWPRLGLVRGRVMFLLDNGGSVRDAYLAGHPSLAGRVLFTDGTPGDPDAAFVKANDPLFDAGLIPGLVGAGYLVRTRADADTVQARSGDTTQRDAALASGAQFVSTDYPVPNPAFGTGYVVRIPGNTVARCNPVLTAPGCRPDALEHLE
jgi:hypothetical protein